MDGIFYDGVTYSRNIKKWKVCRVNSRTHHLCEELVTGLSLYDAVVELRWQRKCQSEYPQGYYFAIFPNREKIYRKEAA